MLRLWQSSLGKKYVMAVTGLGLYLFVIVHMAGNLQIYLGEDKINSYAHFLKANAGPLWVARLALLGMVGLHITTAIQLWNANRRARPVGYAVGKPVASTFAQRTIIVSGLIILAFILFHLSHFTLGLVDSSYMQLRDAEGRPNVYAMMVAGFSNPAVSGFYIVSMGLLMLHLSHGVSSIFQSLGLRSRKTFGFFDRLAKLTAGLIFLGNCSIPISILMGWVK